jgi:hypothetical protein
VTKWVERFVLYGSFDAVLFRALYGLRFSLVVAEKKKIINIRQNGEKCGFVLFR